MIISYARPPEITGRLAVHPPQEPDLSTDPSRQPLLQLDALTVSSRRTPLVHRVDLRLDPGERVALLGASGSGKSLTAAAVLGTLHPALDVTGQLSLDGRPVAMPGSIRTRAGLAAIGQDSRAALNPLVSVGSQVTDAARRSGQEGSAAQTRALDLLAQLGFEDPDRIARSHPGALSGGQRQRACIALALATRAQLVVADEPTTALDTISQAEVVRALQRATGKDAGPALLFITHDVAVAAQLCTRAVVMADGRIVEEATMDDLLARPQATWTRRLVAAARAETAALQGRRVTEVAA